MPSQQKEVSLLILGAGWLFQFLHALLLKHNISFAATTTTGHEGTIEWTFPDAPDEATHETNDVTHDINSASALTSSDVITKGFEVLPPATAVLITFPVKGSDSMRRLIGGYEAMHPENGSGRKWILLGSTGIYAAPSNDSIPTTTPAPSSTSMSRDVQGSSNSQAPPPPSSPSSPPTTATAQQPSPARPQSPPFPFLDESSPPTPSPRYHAEQALLTLKPHSSTVLNLAGLHGEPLRDAKIWDRAVPRTKRGVGGKGSVHFICGEDVSRLVLGIVERGGEGGKEEGKRVEKEEREGEVEINGVWGKRWIVTDCVVYDWWYLIWQAAPYLESTLPEAAKEGEGRGSGPTESGF